MSLLMQVLLLLAGFYLSSASVQESDGWKSKTGPNSQQACKQKPDFHWNGEKGMCLPCTKCHPLGLVTLLGCSPTKDALCGTMQDFKKQMEEQILRRSRSDDKKGSWQPYRVALSDEARYPDDEESDDEVFGKTVKFTLENGNKNKNKYSRNRNDGATHQIRQTVKNLSQRKNEFLRQLQEEENIGREVDAPVPEEDPASSPFDDLEGQVKFSVDQSVSEEKWVRSGNLHEDLRLIEKELLNGGFKREGGGKSPKDTNFKIDIVTTEETVTSTMTTSMTTTTTSMTTSTTTTSTTSTTEITTTTTRESTIRVRQTRTSTLPTTTIMSTTTLPDWLKEDYNIDEEENLVASNEQFVGVDNDDQIGNRRFVPSTSFDNFGTEDDKDDEIFGAVVKNPSYEEDESGRVPDEFGLLSRILYKNDGRSSQQKGQTTAENTGLDLTHSLIIIGFVIGFSLVFGVGLLYTKVIRIKRFKLLDNRASTASSVGETSLLASRTSSFLRNVDNRQATSPLLQGHQSPQLTSRTVVATSLETDPPLIITEPSLTPSPSGSGASSPGNYSNGVHASYVDRLGRTVLKPVRELPV